MGVQGPALATVCSQGLSGILCLFYMRKKFPILKFKPGEAKVRPSLMKKLFLMGAPMGLQYSITAIGSVILQASVNTLGSLAVAAVTASSRLNMVFANCILDSLGAAMATYCGQNLGAGKYERIVEGIKKAILLGGIYCIFGFIVMYLFSDKLAMLFLTDTGDTVLVGMIRQWVVTNSIFYFGLCVLAVLRFSIQGLGYSMVALSSGIAEMIARIFVAWALIAPLGFTASALSNPISWVLADIALIPSILFVLKKVRKQLQ